MEFTCEQLGISKEELQTRVVEGICEKILYSKVYDEDGEWYDNSEINKQLQNAIAERIDSYVSAIGEKHILPRIDSLTEDFVLQKTNQWGEKVGNPKTFIEYMVDRAENFIKEPVNYKGKTKDQDSYSWSKNGTRIEYLINSNLQYSISCAVKQMLNDANRNIVGGIEEAIKIKLKEVQQKLKITAKV